MTTNLKAHIAYLLCIRIARAVLVTRAATATAYLLETASEVFFCKVNTHSHGFAQFQCEKEGLAAIAKTKTIATPNVLLCTPWETGGVLVLEYIKPLNTISQDMALFGHQVAALHTLATSDTYGWQSNNFIGTLSQANTQSISWVYFYTQQRLVPQLRLAYDSKLLSAKEIPSDSRLLKTCEGLFSDLKPCLLHGDLWHGNALISQDGTPYVIDPAVYYGHHEADIAMTRLFGGFDEAFYGAYKEHFPEIGGETARNDIYQLYYLLVHLNLFGASYYDSCKHIIQRYFS